MKTFNQSSLFFLLIIAFFSCKKSSDSTPANPVAVVTTLAGNGTNGYIDGTGAGARFNHPYGVAVDAAGNVYVGDEGNNLIRKITPAGVVSTLAGGKPGAFTDGTGSGANFSSPDGVALDASGNLYVADLLNYRIREVSPGAVVTTVAGGTEGYVDGAVASAEFYYVYDLTVSSQGNLFIADAYNQRIRELTTAGLVSTFAGSGATGPGNGGFAEGPAASAIFQGPQGIAIDAAGNLYVADHGNNRIRKITTSGVVSTLAGDGSTGEVDGVGTAAEFAGPNGLVVDPSGNIFVVDEANTVRKITPAGVVSTIAGGTVGYADGTSTNAEFSGPTSIALDAAGNLYVADYGNGAIRKISFK